MFRYLKLYGILAVALLLMSRVQAQPIGVGALMGDPTGISVKTWTGANSAIDFALAWSTDRNSALHFHMTYLHHDFGVFQVTKGRLPLYYGIGGRIEDANDTRVGMRGAVGLDYIFARTPLDLFIEVAPTLDVTPATEMDVEGGLGVRFFFR